MKTDNTRKLAPTSRQSEFGFWAPGPRVGPLGIVPTAGLSAQTSLRFSIWLRSTTGLKPGVNEMRRFPTATDGGGMSRVAKSRAGFMNVIRKGINRSRLCVFALLCAFAPLR